MAILSFRLAYFLAFFTYVNAFYTYDPNHPTIKHDHIVSIGDYISKGFAYTGPDAPQQLTSALHRLTISRRALPANTNPSKRATVDMKRLRSRIVIKDQVLDEHLEGLERRVNDYKIIPGSSTSNPTSAAIDQDGTDYSYFTEVQFGSGGKTLYMLLDTGAPNTWVMSPDCRSSACSKHLSYGPSDSTTLVSSTDTFTIGYGTGDVSGHVITDTVAMADLTVTLTFGSASVVSDNFANWPMDGLLGLGRFSGNVMKGDTYLQAVANLKKLPALLFGVNLSRNSDGSTDGEINFGAPDSTKYQGSISYTTMNVGQQGWEIPVDDMTVGGTPLQLTGNQAFIDTGTTYMLIPATDAQVLFSHIHGAVNGGDYWNLPCDTTTEITVIFNGIRYPISPRDYVGDAQGGNMCQSHIIGHAALGDKQWLLGDTFMKNVYTVFDSENARIGFGVKTVANSQVPPPPASSPPASPSSAALSPTRPTPKPGSSSAASNPQSKASSISSPTLNAGIIPAGVMTASASSSSGTQTPGAQIVSASPMTGGSGKTVVLGWMLLMSLGMLVSLS